MELQPFRFDDDHSVRVVGTPESPEFVAADVASALGYRMASDMTRRLDEDDRGTRSVRTGDYGVADAAKVLSRDPAISIGRDRLFRFMTEKLGRPYLHEPTGQMRNPDPTVRVSAKGLAELHKRLGGSGQLPLIASA